MSWLSDLVGRDPEVVRLRQEARTARKQAKYGYKTETADERAATWQATLATLAQLAGMSIEAYAASKGIPLDINGLPTVPVEVPTGTGAAGSRYRTTPSQPTMSRRDQGAPKGSAADQEGSSMLPLLGLGALVLLALRR